MSKCKDCVVGLLGACAGDYCRVEREILIEQALEHAAEHRHVLGPFVKRKGAPVWEACCTRCGKTAAITLDPAPGEPDLSGEVLTTECG